jgi:hypothetical protein
MNEPKLLSDPSTNAPGGTLAADPLEKAGHEAGAKLNPLEPSSNDPKHNEGTGPAGTEEKRSGGFLGNLFNTARSNKAACDCGKTPGTTGRHRKGCALEKGNGWFSPKSKTVVQHDSAASPVHFGAPVAQPGALDQAAGAPVVSPIEAATPRDHSFYGKAAETFVRFRLRWKQWRVEKKCTPILGRKEAKEMAAGFELPEADVKELEQCMTECAAQCNWPKVHPGFKAGMVLLSIEGHLFIADQRLSDRLAEMKELLEEQRKLSKGSPALSILREPEPKTKGEPVSADWKNAIAPETQSAPMTEIR